MKSSPVRRVLIVANRTAATPSVLDRVKQLARERPSEFTLLIPDAAKSARTDWTIEHAVPLLERAAGGPVDGLTGGQDAFESVQAAVQEGNFDQIIISTLPRKVSKWLRRDLVRRVEGLGLPVTAIESADAQPPDPGAWAALSG